MGQADGLLVSVQFELEPAGILALGWFEAEDGRPGLLLGNKGGSQWAAFSSSAFANDGQPDPMNRWTQSLIEPLALKLDAKARYPFGDDVWPFQRWAQEAMGVRQSPIGLMIHPDFGLWWALRGALVFDEAFDLPAKQTLLHPCNTCVTKPCLTTCPVDAFGTEGYDVAACRSHVRSKQGRACREQGCMARRACPIGQDFAYSDVQQIFHMSHFL